MAFISGSAFSQFSVGVAANYTSYKGDFLKATPGALIRLGYKINEKATAHLGFNYGFPIKQASSVVIADDDNNTTDVASEIKYNFKTFSLTGNYRFIGLTKQPVVSMARTAQDLFLSATKRI